MLCHRQKLSKICAVFSPKFQHRRPLSSSNFVELAGFTASTDSKQYAAKKLLLLQDGTHRSYTDVNVASGRYAALLSKQYGIQKGDTVLCRASKNVDALALYLAVLRLGAIYVPLNPTYTKRETEHFVNDAKPKVMVTLNATDDASFTQAGFGVKHVLCETQLAKDALKHEPSCEVEAAKADDVACILYTSGTTGRPKGAMVTHGGLVANAETCTEIWHFSAEDVNLHVLPFYHIHGLFISFNCTLMSKSSCIFLPKFELNETISYLPMSTVMMGVPTFYARMVEHPGLDRAAVKNMRVFISGSAQLTPQVFDKFEQMTGMRILERYGMTETLVSTSNPYEPVNARTAGSVGQPVKGVQARINADGVIEVKSPSLFNGYLNLSEKTKQEFTADGFFITGDMGEIDENGYVWIKGRQKDLIISGGLNVYPTEVEDVVTNIFGEKLKECAIIGVPHTDFGEAVVAVCEASDAFKAKLNGTHQLTDEERSAFRQILAPYKIPKAVHFMPLPRNHLGKVQKNVLRAMPELKELFAVKK